MGADVEDDFRCVVFDDVSDILGLDFRESFGSRVNYGTHLQVIVLLVRSFGN